MRYVLIGFVLLGSYVCKAQVETDPVYFSKEDRAALRESKAKKFAAQAQLNQSRFQNPDYQASNRTPDSKNKASRYWDRRYATAQAPRLSVGIGYGMPAWHRGYGYRNSYMYDPFFDPWYCQRGYWGLNNWNSPAMGWNSHIGWGYGSMFYDPWAYNPYGMGFYNPYSFGFYNPYASYYSRPSYVPRNRVRAPEPPRVNTTPNTIRRPTNTNSSPSYRPSPTFSPSNQRGSSGGSGGTYRGGSGGGGNSPSPGIRRPR